MADAANDAARAADKVGDAAEIGSTILRRARAILGDLPLNSKSLDDLYQAGRLSMDEARALAKSVDWKDTNGGWIYPPNQGFHTEAITQQIAAGSKLDRYGGYTDRNSGQFRDTGNFLSPEGTPYGSRALPPGTREAKDYKVYEVKISFDAQVGQATPWFGETGLGRQIMTDRAMNIEYLLKRGYITEIE